MPTATKAALFATCRRYMTARSQPAIIELDLVDPAGVEPWADKPMSGNARLERIAERVWLLWPPTDWMGSQTSPAFINQAGLFDQTIRVLIDDGALRTKDTLARQIAAATGKTASGPDPDVVKISARWPGIIPALSKAAG